MIFLKSMTSELSKTVSTDLIRPLVLFSDEFECQWRNVFFNSYMNNGRAMRNPLRGFRPSEAFTVILKIFITINTKSIFNCFSFAKFGNFCKFTQCLWSTIIFEILTFWPVSVSHSIVLTHTSRYKVHTVFSIFWPVSVSHSKVLVYRRRSKVHSVFLIFWPVSVLHNDVFFPRSWCKVRSVSSIFWIVSV